jgi:ABC-type phosphate/phosphonate transport system substrate-binding protein
MRARLQSIILVAVGSFVLTAVCAADTECLKIGMAKSFFSGTPKVLVDLVGSDFADVMKKTTGLDGELNTSLDPYELGQRLNDRKLDFAIFHGHEFASVRKQYPTLRPLLIVANKHGDRAYLIVHRNSNAQSPADLGGKKVDLALDAREYCRVFLSKIGADHRKGEGDFFGSVMKSALQIEALNELARGKIDAAIVDSVGLAHYTESRGPVFTKNLRILLESDAFPAPVFAYKRDALDEKVIKQFRDGLVKAKKTDVGRRVMNNWKIDSFDLVPKNYDKNLSEVLKSYPLPAP